MPITPFLTFPREGIPAPEEKTALGTLAIPYFEGQPPKQTQPVFWFCCACAMAGREDPVGLLYDEYHTKCPVCKHLQCGNCGLSWARRKEYMIRTKSGLYASPNYVDPFHWECLCGEWRLNILNEDTVIGKTRCANPRCLGQAAGWPPVNLDTIVMNKFGQRLGILDQSIMQAEGPWAMQRKALGDPAAALVAGLRPGPFRSEVKAGVPELWREGKLAPRYPPRPPSRSSHPADAYTLSSNFQAYIRGYMRGLPFEPRGSGGKQKEVDENRVQDHETYDIGYGGGESLPTPPATNTREPENE
ncbi:hypothetical protein GQ53DRAFT_801407 [Thozetella sp. PMI_491]|nr:hypothetical protein GQ53DRAFT_801407 [Thozetella sp. PMI_491]